MYGKIIATVLVAILLVNTVRKSHVCNHEPPLTPDQLIALDQGAIGRLVGALRFRTISYEDESTIDYGEFRAFWSFIRTHYPVMFGERTETTWISEYTLLVKISGTNAQLKPGLFLAHCDVVPTDVNLWDSDPFEPVISNGYIQARGIFDNKGLLLAHLEAISVLLERNIQLERDLYWLFPHDEEIGGANGVVKTIPIFKEKYNIDQFEFIVDEGIPPVRNLIPLNDDYMFMIGYTAKGGVTVDLDVTFEKAGHASVPASESAIIILNKALDRVASSPQPNMFGTSIEYNTFEQLTPYLPFPASVLTANLWLFGGLISRLASLDNKLNANIRTTSAITMVSAGYKSNVIPTTAHATIDNRIHPGHSINGTLEHLKRVINDERVVITSRSGSKEPDPMTNPDSPIGKQLARSIQRTMSNTVPIPAIFIALADSRWLTDFSDSIFRLNPLKMNKQHLAGIHGPNERIQLDSYQEAVNFLFDFYTHLDTFTDFVHNEL